MLSAARPLSEALDVQEAAESLAYALASSQDFTTIHTLLHTSLQTYGAPLAARLSICLRSSDPQPLFAFIQNSHKPPLPLLSLFGLHTHPQAKVLTTHWLQSKVSNQDTNAVIDILRETVLTGTGLRLVTLVHSVVTPLLQGLELTPVFVSLWTNRDTHRSRQILQLVYFCGIDHFSQVILQSFQVIFAKKSVAQCIEETLILDAFFPDFPEVAFELRKALSEKMNTSDGIRDFAIYLNSLISKGSLLQSISQLFLLVSNKDLFEQLYRKDVLLRVLEGSNVEIEREVLEELAGFAPPGVFQRTRSMLVDLSVSDEQW